MAAERVTLVKALMPDARVSPVLSLPEELLKSVEPEEAAVALMRGRVGISGPVTSQKMADDLGLSLSTVEIALARLEAEGVVLQGRYTSDALKPEGTLEWCERRLLARIHRLTLEGARKRIQPVPPENYWMDLAEYHHLLPDSHREGQLGLREALGQLEGFEMAAGAWEMDVLAGRVEKYQSEWLDHLSFSGELVWGRLRPPAQKEEEEPSGGGLTRVVPITLAFREDLSLASSDRMREGGKARRLMATYSLVHARPEAQLVHKTLQQNGALFVHDLAQVTGLVPTRLRAALSELAALGLVTADGFAALRALAPVRRWERTRRRHTGIPKGISYAGGGRWTLFPPRVKEIIKDDRLNSWAILLLRRYGIVFRDLLTRETVAPAWWELTQVYRRMEARGEIRGGRFVAGVGGEQYAMPEAVEAVRRSHAEENSWVIVSAADPLNLAGIVLSGVRVPAVRGNRLLFHNGRLSAALQAGELKFFENFPDETKEKVSRALRLTQLPQLREEILKELSAQVGL